MTRLNPDRSQLEFISSKASNIRLLAPAGSGKTASILLKCKSIVEESAPQRIKLLIFTFTRVARDELMYRLSSDDTFMNIRDSVKIETLNQFGFNFLKNNRTGIEIKSSKQDSFFLVKNVLKSCYENDEFFSSILKNLNFTAHQLITCFDTIKSMGFTHIAKTKKELYQNFNDHYNWLVENKLERFFKSKFLYQLEELKIWQGEVDKFEPKELHKFLSFWKDCVEKLWEAALLTVEDQKYWANIELEKKYKDKSMLAVNKYSHIIVDEFQDINVIDLYLIRTLARIHTSNLVLVGDDDQAIFEWRGSSPDFILNPDKYFDKSFITFTLAVNYRSPKNIVDQSMRLIEHNTNRVIKLVSAYNNTNAKIDLLRFDNTVEALEDFKSIASKYVDSDKKIAFIARKKSQLIPLQIMLASSDIPFFAKEDLNILLSKAFIDLKDILEIINYKDNKRPVKDMLPDFMKFANQVRTFPLKKSEITELYRYFHKEKPRSFSELILKLLEFRGELKGKNDGTTVLEFYNAINSVLCANSVSDTILKISTNLHGLQKHYAKSIDDIFYKDPPFSYLVDYALKYNDDYDSFIEHLDKSINAMSSPLNEIDEKLDDEINLNIHLMTALRAKGKEFHHVVILDANDGIWPNKFAESKEEYEAERRIFYVAVTRAKKILSILHVSEIMGKQQVISPFVTEFTSG